MNKKIISICVVCVMAGTLVGVLGTYWVMSQVFTPPSIYLDAIPSTASYVIRNDGTYTYAVNWNGKIDFYGADAGTVVNQAISANGTHRVFLKYAIYNIGTPIVAQSDLEIDAEPRTEIRRTTDNNYLLNIDSRSNVIVRNLVFDGADVQTSPLDPQYPKFGLIYIAGSSRVTLDHIEVRNVGRTTKNPPRGIEIRGSHDIRIYNSYIHDNQGSGIEVESGVDGTLSYNIFIESNTINDNTLQYAPGVFGGIVLANVQNSTVAFNKIRRATWGIECPGKDFKWNTIIGNEIIGSTDPSVINEDGIEIYDEGASENRVIGNTLAHWGENPAIMGTAIDVGQPYLSYTEDGVSRNIVSGNVITVSLGGVGVMINGKYNTITENSIKKGTANATSLGIVEKAGISDYNKILNNDVSTLPITFDRRIHASGANTIVHYNSGYKTEASGYVDVTGDVNVVWVTHGLAYRPRDGFPQVTAIQSGQGAYWVSDQNATHFAIRFQNKPGMSYWGFEWYAES